MILNLICNISYQSAQNIKCSLPFGLLTLFRLLRPTNLRARVTGLGVLRLFKYRAKMPNNAIPAVNDTITTCKMLKIGINRKHNIKY